MELRQLRYFLAVAEELNFGRAAERMHIVQPAISQQIQRLERELGVALFERSTRRVSLSEAGHRLVPRARAVLAAEDAARASVDSVRAARSSTLRVGTATGLGVRLLSALAVMRQLAPGVTVELISLPVRERLRRLADHLLDAAIVRGQVTASGLRVRPVWEDDLLIALPRGHALADAEAPTLNALADIPLRLVAHDQNPVLVDAVRTACQAAGFDPIPAAGMPAATDEDLLAAIAAGGAWTVYYASRARQLNAEALGVTFIAPADRPITVSTSIVVRAGRTPAVTQQFLQACMSQGRRLAEPPSAGPTE